MLNDADKIYLGGEVDRIFMGDTEVWPSADRYDYLENGVLDLLALSDVEYVIVAGGGGGGGSTNSIRGAGGGGAGGVLTGTVTLPPGTYPVTVGAGGAGGAGDTSVTVRNGTPGGNSTFAGMVAIGGGGSSWADNGGGRDGQPGGSGAGGSAQAGQGGAGTPGQGHPGGTATGAALARGGAGGGGAGGPGQDGQSNAAGLGGAGISVWGRTYAAGGRGGHTGGGGAQNPGDGGQGGYSYSSGWDGAGGIVALKVRALPTITVTPQAPTFHDGEPWVTLPDVEGVNYSISGTPAPGETVTVTATALDGYELDGTSSWTHTFPLTPVTPTPPTFHDGEPWITLPTVAGVTYTVSGTPGYEQSVTVTATAQAGYELVGTSSWTHTYGPEPRYTASGSGGRFTANPVDTWVTVDTHTVTRDTSAVTVEWTAVWAYTVLDDTYEMRVVVDGNTLTSDLLIAPKFGPKPRSATVYDIPLDTGDVLSFQVRTNSTSSDYTRRIDSWNWSLS